MIQAKDFRADRVHGALLLRRAKLQEMLAMRDRSGTFDPVRGGFPFIIQGPTRGRLEDELRFIEETLALFDE